MKKRWPSGLLLGLSMALILSGGVALAQGTLRADKTCVNCVPEEFWAGGPDHQLPGEQYLTTITGEGWTPSSKCTDGGADAAQLGEVYHELRWSNGEVWPECAPLGPDGSLVWGPWAWACEICPEDMIPRAYEAGARGEACVPALGDMEYYFEDDTGGRSVFVLLAEDCAAAEFVPEPGSVLLLGSGLMGLAGYAGLRWRSRQ